MSHTAYEPFTFSSTTRGRAVTSRDGPTPNLAAGTAHRTGVWIANQKELRDRLKQARLRTHSHSLMAVTSAVAS